MRSPIDFEDRTDLPGTTNDSLVASP